MSPIVSLDNLQQFAAVNLLSDPGYDRSDHRIPNTAQITLLWGMEDGKVAHNVLYGQYQGGFAGSQAQCNAILTQLATGNNWTALAGFLATSTILTGVLIRDRNAEDQPIIPSSVAGAAGTSPSAALPNEVAAVVTKRTAFTGQAHRGRIYIPGWATNALGTGNVIAAGAVTALNNWASIIAGVLQSQGYLFGIGHPHRVAYQSANGTQHAERPAGFVPITAVTVRDNHWDSQRRRGLR